MAGFADSIRNIWKVEELRKRIIYTITLLLVYRLGAQVTLPGVDASILAVVNEQNSANNLFGFLDSPGGEKTALAETPPRIAPLATGYVLEDVAFRYPGRPNDVLAGINLSIGATEKLAIVGENGAGKTTVVKLLTGLYRPTRGVIRLDGVPLDQIPPEVLRARIGTVLQDYVRYQLTARDNVAFGAIDALDDEPRLERAAERGGSSEVVAQLPNKWQTQLGRWFEAGTELSAGQWQKLAVSRAYMREASILVLDEPSASLDAEAEHALFSRLKALTEGKMALLISHRFSSVRMADRIAVIHEGRIAELGSHDALMSQDGRYARLFRLQAEGYLR